MKYTKIIIGIACLCSLNCSFGQFNAFIKNFKKCSFPFVIKEETFDIYQADDDVYAILETDFVKYLVMENDTSVNIFKKSLPPIGYHKYIAVCRFDVYDNLLGAVYFRAIKREKSYIQELVLCMFTKQGKLISTYPISGYYTAEKKTFFSTIFNEESIEISFYKLEAHEDKFGISYLVDKNVIEKQHLYITKEGFIEQRK